MYVLWYISQTLSLVKNIKYQLRGNFTARLLIKIIHLFVYKFWSLYYLMWKSLARPRVNNNKKYYRCLRKKFCLDIRQINEELTYDVERTANKYFSANRTFSRSNNGDRKSAGQLIDSASLSTMSCFFVLISPHWVWTAVWTL